MRSYSYIFPKILSVYLFTCFQIIIDLCVFVVYMYIYLLFIIDIKCSIIVTVSVTLYYSYLGFISLSSL
jgi:hypothetical protein